MGHFGISYLEVYILFEQWVGHRLLSEKVNRPPRTCSPSYFLFLLLRYQKESKFGKDAASSLALLGPWQVPWWVRQVLALCSRSHMSRLRHSGWEQCSHGLTSWPLESCHHQCLRAVCGGFSLSFGWYSEAPLLHRFFYQAFSPLVTSQIWWVVW